MHIHIPKPLHGWRALAGEIGVIVIGVLIALAAEQIVETASWRSESRDFRAAVDDELGKDLTIYQVRLRQNACVARRLAELQRLVAQPDAAPPLQRLRPISYIDTYSYYFSVWDNKDPMITAHLPVDVRTRYAEIYDEFRNEERNRVAENELWRSLGQFDLPEPLDHADRMRLTELLGRARLLDANRRLNWDVMAAMAKGLGLHPRPLPFKVWADANFCLPLFGAPRSE